MALHLCRFLGAAAAASWLLLASASSAQVASEHEIGCAPGDTACEDADLANVHLLQSDLRIDMTNGSDGSFKTVPPQVHFAQNEIAGDDVREAETTTTTTLPPDGTTMNARGDGEAFFSALLANTIAVVAIFFIFSELRIRFPIIYSDNVLKGFAPSSPDTNLRFSWFRAATSMTIEEASDSIGLDNAMLLEFSHLCIKILVIVGLPMFFIMGPINYTFGGHPANKQLDNLSSLSFGNVENGSWLYWIHAFVIWYVVAAVQICVYGAQREFIQRRFDWLRRLAPLRANTVLVEGIPHEYQADSKLKAYFEVMIPGARVRDASVVKDTSALAALVSEREAAKDTLRKAEATWELTGRDPGSRPLVRSSLFGHNVDSIDHYSSRLKELAPMIKMARETVLRMSQNVGGVNMPCGFVTFHERWQAEVCLKLDCSFDNDEWVMSTPPEPLDILWSDLQQDPTAQSMRTLGGYLLVGLLYFAYMPLVVTITNIAKVINMGPLQPLWAGLAPTMGLQVMVAFLPTFLILIFKFFFTLKADAWSQHKLQIWYYWFQIFFVILATAVGQDTKAFTKALVEDPLGIPSVLAETMPYATHFYMNFMVLQWVTHSMNVLRYVPLMKYKAAMLIFEEDQAKKLAEPEDQDYYGIGSRSARWTIAMNISIIFGTLSPPVGILGLVNFAVIRVVYGYLFCFAETKKPDLGGVFWVTCLRGLFIGNIIYCVLMVGVLFERAATSGPAMIAMPSLAYVFWSMHRFERVFNWEKLPHELVMQKDAHITTDKIEGTYVQPELLE